MGDRKGDEKREEEGRVRGDIQWETIGRGAKTPESSQTEPGGKGKRERVRYPRKTL